MDVLADDHRLQPDVHHSACAWVGRDAAARLYLSGSAGLGLDEHGLDHRRVFHGGRVDSCSCGIWLISLFRGKPAGDNPWNAWTLEWATTSPPPHENFHALPPIRSRRPLWDYGEPRSRRSGRRQWAERSIPFRPEKNKASVIDLHHFRNRLFRRADPRLSFLQRDAAAAGRARSDSNVLKTGIFSVCLFASSFTIWRSEVAACIETDNAQNEIGWLAATILLGGIFIVGQGMEYWDLFQQRRDCRLESFRHDIFHAHRFSRLARLRGFDRVADRARRCVWSRFQKPPRPCARRRRVVLALRRCRLGVRVLDRLPFASSPMTTRFRKAGIEERDFQDIKRRRREVHVHSLGQRPRITEVSRHQR